MEEREKGNSEPVTSEELAVKAAGGAEECFDELVLRHRSKLFNYLRKKTQSIEDAEDVTQEAFTRAFEKIGTFDPTRKFETWLFTIGSRLLISKHRKKRYEQTALDENDHLEQSTPETILSGVEENANLWNTISGLLTSAQMEAMWCRYGDNLTIKETAQKTGKTQVHIKVLLHRARTVLAKELKDKRQDL